MTNSTVPRIPTDEEEQARFEVTYTAHSLYSTEITASTLAELQHKVEKIYDKTDLDRFAFDSHDEEWKPLNAAAIRLLEEDAREQELQQRPDEILANDQSSSLFARVFASIWCDLRLKSMLLAKVRHELSHEASQRDIADVVLTILEEDVPALDHSNLREELEVAHLIEFLVAWVGKVPLDPDYKEQNGIEEREQSRGTIDFTLRGNITLKSDDADHLEDDAKALLACLDSNDKQVLDFTIFDVEVF